MSGTVSLVAAAREAMWSRRPQNAFTIIDSHAHLGQDAVMYMPVYRAADLVRVMDRCGVAAAVSSSLLGIRVDARAGNDETARTVDEFPGRFMGAMVVNPWQAPGAEVSRWADDARMTFIKLHPDVHEYALSGRRYDPVFEWAESTGCPVITHAQHESPFSAWGQLDDVCERFPGLRLIAGHSGVFPRGIDRGIELAERHLNLHFELCGSFSHRRDIEVLVRRVGTDRVVYGSDFPFIDLRYALGRALFSDLSDEQMSLVLGGNAERLISWRSR